LFQQIKIKTLRSTKLLVQFYIITTAFIVVQYFIILKYYNIYFVYFHLLSSVCHSNARNNA